MFPIKERFIKKRTSKFDFSIFTTIISLEKNLGEKVLISK